MALGKNVEHLRTLRAMSRGAVARAIGLEDDQPIYALEKRDSKRSNLAPALAKLFQVSLESLLDSDLTMLTLTEIEAQASQPTAQGVVDDKLAFFADVLQKLSPSSGAELKRYAEYLLAKEKGSN